MFKKLSIFIILALMASSGFSQRQKVKNQNYTSVYNVRDFGAVGDGKTLDQLAINKAIETCANAGGGTVTLTAGTYLCGSIRLKSNINLCIDAGATILGAPQEMNAYDPAESFPFPRFQDGGHSYFHNSLIWGENLKNVSITGRGMINGGGLTHDDHDNDFTLGPIGKGDKAIALKLCSNVLIRDITIFHGGHFAILATGCDLVTMDNLTIDTNRDGIDVDCCTNTVISNCRVNSPNDDAICPKSSYALNKPVITENLLITNCEVSGYKEGTLLDGTRIPVKVTWSSGRIKFGTESNGGFRNCVVSNCIFRNCNGLALELVDGGIMENIIVTNITMQDLNHYPIYVCLGKRNRGPEVTTKMGSVKNIFISNVIATGASSMSGIQIVGSPSYPLENIQLENIQVVYKGGGTVEQSLRDYPELGRGYPEPSLLGIAPFYGLMSRHVNDLRLNNISFKTETPDYRPAVICTNVNGLEIIDFKAPIIKDVVPYRFNNVTDISVRYSPIFEK